LSVGVQPDPAGMSCMYVTAIALAGMQQDYESFVLVPEQTCQL
jgi:hypothetical protein